jgi:alkaline phosphatase
VRPPRSPWPALAVPTLAASLLLTAVPATADDHETAGDEPRNIILLIADGMGFNHVDAASLWQYGEAAYQSAEANPLLAEPGQPSVDSQIYQDFPVRIAAETGYVFSPDYDSEGTWAHFDNVRREATFTTASGEEQRILVTDSGAAGTAMSAGVRTRRVLGLDRDREPVSGVVDSAFASGRTAGLVTNQPFWATTTAAFAVNQDESADPQSISDEILRNEKLTVLMGGGHPDFDSDGQPRERDLSNVGEDLWGDLLGDDPSPELASWTLIDDREGIVALAEADDVPERVFGLAPNGTNLQHGRSGDREQPFGTPFLETSPRLHEMARSTYQVLDANSDEGFFALIEAATVDSAGHEGELGRTIEDMVEFNLAVEETVDWVEENSSWDDTMVIATSDHETGYLLGPDAGPTEDHPLGWTALTGEAGELPEADFYDFTDGEPGDRAPHYHTNQLVPVYAKGAGSQFLEARATKEDIVRGPYIHLTDIAHTVFELWGDPPPFGEDPDPEPEPEPVDPPAPRAPTDKDQCRNGGWQDLDDPSFRNRGQCVSFVTSGELRGPPANANAPAAGPNRPANNDRGRRG